MASKRNEEYYQKYNDWNYSQIDLWELKNEPKHITPNEAKMANQILESFGIDIEDYTLISIMATPNDMANLIINISRLINRRY